MAQRAFLERFYDAIDDHIGDPRTSRRITRQAKREQLAVVEVLIWEQLMKACGQESLIGRTETTVTLKNNIDRYALPGNFRQFITMERRETISGRTRVTNRRGTLPYWSGGWGFEIISAQRGMILRPPPDLDADQDWTLVYLKGPIIGHYAKAKEVGDKTITMGTPGADAGEIVDKDDYYKGSIVRIYAAGKGAMQEGEVVSSDAKTGTCHMQHAWSPKPDGDVYYEFAPELPIGYDDVYSLMVAIKNMPRRGQRQKMAMMIAQMKEQMRSCRQFFSSNVADRPPTRAAPHEMLDYVLPYYDGT